MTVIDAWPHLRLTEPGRERLGEVLTFLATIEAEGHPLAERVKQEFLKRLGYLDEYGGAVSEEDERRRFRVTLGRDWAPYSFTLLWERLDLRDDKYVYAMTGALIWHGGANDPLTVCLGSDVLWGIHT